MSQKLEHSRHRTYFLASSLSLTVLAVPGIFILLLDGAWDINQTFIIFT